MDRELFDLRRRSSTEFARLVRNLFVVAATAGAVTMVVTNAVTVAPQKRTEHKLSDEKIRMALSHTNESQDVFVEASRQCAHFI